MIEIGFHTDAFNSAYWSFDQCLEWAHRNGLHFIECGAIDGASWIHGLGYQPHIALWEDPLLLRRKMDRYGIRFSQLDASFPLSRPEGATLGVEYVNHTIRYAKLVGCPLVNTTDDRHHPAGMSDREAMEHMRLIYSRIIPVAEAYGVGINIEPHGYYSSRPEFMEEMLSFSNSPYLRMNMDTGNVFMAGHNPVAFLQRFLRKVSHVHAKDVTPTVAAARGREQTGIAVSQCALGDGVNAENIRACVERLVRADYNGVVSINCEGHGGPMIERSLAWLRGIVNLTWEEAQVAVHA